MNKIYSFSGKYYFLSNFSLSNILVEGLLYPSVEHAFQALKTLDEGLRLKIKNAYSPREAKRLGRSLKLRDDWEDVKVNVMRDILRVKFNIPELKKKLLETGDAELIEGNTWGDKIWGQVNGEGKNLLGKLLMEIRDELNVT